MNDEKVSNDIQKQHIRMSPFEAFGCVRAFVNNTEHFMVPATLQRQNLCALK